MHIWFSIDLRVWSHILCTYTFRATCRVYTYLRVEATREGVAIYRAAFPVKYLGLLPADVGIGRSTWLFRGGILNYLSEFLVGTPLYYYRYTNYMSQVVLCSYLHTQDYAWPGTLAFRDLRRGDERKMRKKSGGSHY